MRSRVVPLLLVAALVVLTTGPVHAQAFLLDRWDANKDGKIKRSEIPEGTLRNAYDRVVEQHKLDPDKTYDRKELEKIMGATDSSSSSSSGSTGASNSRGRPSGSGGGPGGSRSFAPPGGSRSFSPRSNGSRPSESTNGSRTSRVLGELPTEYRSLDKDVDGQIGLYEWPKNDIATFLRLDKNDDGFLTLSELRQPSRSDTKEKEKEATKDSKSGDDPPSDAKSDEAKSATDSSP